MAEAREGRGEAAKGTGSRGRSGSGRRSERGTGPETGDPREGESGADPAAELTEGVSEVVSAALGVGASVARAFAEATSGGKPVRPPPGDRPLEVLVHYSLASATNVLGMLGGALGDAARMATGRGATKEGAGGAARETSAAGTGHDAERALPVVAPGATLRLPLSVENPGAEPMRGLAIVCGSVEGEGLGAGSPLGKRHVRFVPEVLDIAPRDFEKLTVFVQTEPDTAAGTYETLIQMGSESFPTPVRFRVERVRES